MAERRSSATNRAIPVNLLDRYIFRGVLFACAAAVAMFTFIVVVPNIARDVMPRVLAGQLPAFTVVQLVLLMLPFALTYALPMGVLTGVLLTLGRLSADSEITAARAAGVSIARLSRPVLVFAVLGLAVGLYFNFDSMPRARVEYHEVLARTVQANPLSFIVPKTFIREFRDRVVYVGDKQGSVLRDVWYWDLDNSGRVTRFVRAESGRIDYDAADNAFVLTLVHVQAETRNDRAPEDFRQPTLVGSFEKSAPLRLSLDRFFGRSASIRVKQEWLTYDRLQAERARLAALPVPADREAAKAAARERMKLELVYHDKFNTSLAVLSLALIGVPLGIKVSRRETSANFAVAVGLTLLYYLMTVAVKALDRHPEYRPDLLLWLPNALMLGFGIWLMFRIERR